MLSKCANPACSADFRYLHQGMLFLRESCSPEDRPASVSNKKNASIEYYWLCDQCARNFTLAVQGNCIRVVPQFTGDPQSGTANTATLRRLRATNRSFRANNRRSD